MERCGSRHAVGQTGTVYLRVPGKGAGPGKVTLNLQNRTVELEAFTAADELPTGTPIRVVAVLGPRFRRSHSRTRLGGLNHAPRTCSPNRPR